MQPINTDHPDRIGPYHIRRTLGEGGMGIVYEAQQTEPVHRRVALKLVKLGMDTRQVVARFEAERQALAVMEHPSIAKVFDAGATDSGRPYFVMELVDGTPITDYCNAHHLSTEARVRLFEHVCHAVQHAHTKGVIHRDLKPSNVLVTVKDEKPVPKVIDFGIAKAVGDGTEDGTQVTRVGQLVGTPEYMSPEQAEASGVDIDTRVDVYSLGVMLYELLVGALPHDLEGTSDYVMRAAILTKDPPSPSARLRTLSGDQKRAVAEQRRTDLSGLQRELRGDLDWIIMKCLEKDRGRRYQTANGMALDLRRYLANEPVEARPPTAGYRLQKFVRRNRVGVAAAGAVGLAIGVGFAATAWQWRSAVEARERMTEALADSRASSEFAFGLFEASDPFLEASGDTLSARTLLARGKERVREQFADQPRIRARMSSEIADVYANLGLLPSADSLATEAVELWTQNVSSDDSTSAALLDRLSTVKSWRGENDTASTLVRAALSTWHDLFGDDHLATAGSFNNLAVIDYYLSEHEEGLDLAERALRIRQRELPADHPDIGEALDIKAAHLQALGRLQEAAGVREAAVSLAKRAHGEDHPAVATQLQNLAVQLGDLDRWEQAETHLREAIEIRTERLGPDHPELGYAYHNLGVNLDRQGQFEDALRHYSEALRLKELNLGRDASYARTLEQMAGAYASLTRYEEAEATYDAVERIYKRGGSNSRVDMAFLNNARGALFLKRERYAEALPVLRAAYESAVEVYGEDHVRTAQFGGNLGAALAGLERVEEARPLLEMSHRIFARDFGDEHSSTLQASQRLGALPSAS